MSGTQRTEVLDVPLEKLFNAITDYVAYPDFVSGMTSAEMIEEGETESVVNFSIDLLKPIQYAIRISKEISEDAGTAVVSWSLESSDFLKANNGRWNLRSLGDDRTEATYSLELDFNITVPGFVRKKLEKNILPKTIHEFGERAKSV